jgi:hypothetical protein
MEDREKPHMDKLQGDYEWLELWRQLYSYITFGLGIRKFQAHAFVVQSVYSV